MRSFVIGLVVLFAVFTFIGALEQPASAPAASLPISQASLPAANP